MFFCSFVLFEPPARAANDDKPDHRLTLLFAAPVGVLEPLFALNLATRPRSVV